MAWFKCSGGGIPAALKSLMNAVLNKKWGTSGTYPPETWPETVNLMGPLEEKTVTGSVVAFPDGADDVPLKSCAVTIAPNLDGVSSVDVVKTGRNLLEIDSSYDIPARATTLTRDYSNNVLHIYGEVQDTNSNYYSQDITDLVRELGTVTIIANTVSGGTADLSFRVNVQDGSTVISRLSIGDTSRTITYTEGYTYLLMFFVSISATVGNTVDMTVNFEADYGSSVGAYTPYVTPTTHTANLGRTIYGGSVDVVSGTGKITYPTITIGELTFAKVATHTFRCNNFGRVYGNGKYNVFSSQFSTYTQGHSTASNISTLEVGNDNTIFLNSGSGTFYISTDSSFDDKTVEDFITVYGNTVLIYETSSTPEDFTFTPVPINSLLGDNTMWGDGDLSVIYRSSGTQTLIPPTLISKTITANGTYSAEDDNADGYDTVTVNVSGGGGGGNTPQATQTLICDNSALGSSLTFTDDYENYDLIKFVVYRSDVQNTFVFYATPAMINACGQYSSNRINFNQPYGNNFVCYTKTSNTSWSRYGVRNMAVQYVYGLTFTNCTVAETELYNRQGIGSSAVTFTPPTGESFLDYDYILFMTCTGNSDETQVNLEVFQPSIEKDIFGSANVKEDTVTVYRYNTGGTTATVTENTITSYQYFYASGLKLNFNQQNLLGGSLNSSNSEEENINSEQEETPEEVDQNESN